MIPLMVVLTWFEQTTKEVNLVKLELASKVSLLPE